MDKYDEAKEMARACLGFTLEDGAEEIRLIAEYLSKVRNESAAEGKIEAEEEIADMIERRSTEGYFCNELAKMAIVGWVRDWAKEDRAAALRAGAGEDAG